ncbi:MAG: zf-HC2 domain-containing protein, partial [Thermoanaerobaculia bacterium]|nr:zf-HC2 domain-containing protein [Thermoanaerobaculia bacterium]
MSSFKRALVDWVDGESTEHAEHPRAELLTRLRRGELEIPEAERVREHLLGCSACMAVWRDPDASAPRDPSTDFELAAFWCTLSASRRAVCARSAGREDPALPPPNRDFSPLAAEPL